MQRQFHKVLHRIFETLSGTCTTWGLRYWLHFQQLKSQTSSDMYHLRFVRCIFNTSDFKPQVVHVPLEVSDLSCIFNTSDLKSRMVHVPLGAGDLSCIFNSSDLKSQMVHVPLEVWDVGYIFNSSDLKPTVAQISNLKWYMYHLRFEIWATVGLRSELLKI